MIHYRLTIGKVELATTTTPPAFHYYHLRMLDSTFTASIDTVTVMIRPSTQCNKKILTLNSKLAIPIPLAAPLPAKPIKCPLPMFEANRLAPTGSQCILLDARKYPFTLARLLL